MRLLEKVPDGGKDSGVTAYILIEVKSLFSIMLLHFNSGSREAFHSHAFNAITIWLKGEVREDELEGGWKYFSAGRWKYTPRTMFHRIFASSRGAWALSFRGPWADTWQEYKNGQYLTLTHGRKEI